MERLLTLYSEVQSTDVRWLWYPAHPIGVYFETENIYTLNPNVYGTETGTCIYKRRTRRTGSGKENANHV